MIIFGTRAYTQAIAIVTFICNNCHNPAAQRVLQRVVKFTLFFIPLFPVSKSCSTTCTFCGLTTKITKEQADQYVAYGAAQQAEYRQASPAGYEQGRPSVAQPSAGWPAPGPGAPQNPAQPNAGQHFPPQS